MPQLMLTGRVLAALLGSAALLAPVSGFAQTPPAQTPSAASKPAPAAPAPGVPIASDADAKKAQAEKAFFDAKLAALHAGLELTPAQAPLWPPVEKAIRDLAHGYVHGAHDEAAGDTLHAQPLEQLQKRAADLSDRAKDLKALTDATGPLVQSLDGPQKEHLPKLLEGAFKGRRVLWAAFNVASPEHEHGEGGDRRPGQSHGQDRDRDRDRDHEGSGDHEHGHDHERHEGGWAHHDGPEHGDGEEGHKWHRWHHWHHHHHHHHWDRDGRHEGGQDGHDEGYHDGGGDWHRHPDHDGGDRT